MKKLFALIVASIIFGGVHSQEVKDQFTLLKDLGEGTIIDMYKIWKTSDGKKEGKRYKQFSLSYLDNQYEKTYSFKGTDVNAHKNPQQTARIIGGENYTGNHYTKPSFIYMESTLSPDTPGKTYAFILIGDVLYKIGGEFSEMKAGGKYYIHEEMYLISKKGNTSSENGEGKKKGKLMGKLKGKLESYNGYEKPAPKTLTEVDHKAVIDDYLKKMEPIMDEATKNFTQKEKDEFFAIQEAKRKRAIEGLSANDAFQEKMAAERAAAKGANDDSRVTISNVGPKEVKVACGYSTYSIHPGGSTTCACSQKITYAVQKGSMWQSGGALISGSGDNCGETVNIR